jgi:hypothetical protein
VRSVGLLLIILGIGGAVAIVRYYSPSAVEARRNRRLIEEARVASERARLLAEENRSIDTILADHELREENEQDDDPRYHHPFE